MQTTKDTKKNGNHLNVRLEDSIFHGFFVSGNHLKILQFGEQSH